MGLPEKEITYSRPDYDISAIDPHWADPQMVKIIGKGKAVLELGCAVSCADCGLMVRAP